jgi:DNA polymerase IV (DinB-like DNA polymerase)
MGIETLGQLAKADVSKLKERFGKNGQWMWKVANGADDEPVSPKTDNVYLSAESTFDAFTRDKDKIYSLLQGLVDGLCLRIREHGYLFRSVGIKLVRTDFSIETRGITFHEFRNDSEIIFSVLGQLLDKFVLSENRPLVRKAGLWVSNLIREENIQRKKTAQRTLLDYC